MSSDNFIKNTVEPIAIYSAIGGCTALATRAVVNYAGRSFVSTGFGVNSLLLTVTLGAIQLTASYPLAYSINQATGKRYEHCFMIATAAITAGFVGLTALAVKTNIVATGLSVPGAMALGLSSFIAAEGLNYYLDD